MGIPLTDQIADIIEQMLRENGGELELQRNKLAGKVGCVPSQINYVITSRFNADRGYIVESRRGGGGYIKITKVSFDSKNTFIAHVISAIGSGIDFADSKALMYALYERKILSFSGMNCVLCMINDNTMSAVKDMQTRNALRAEMLKSFILTLNNC